MDIKIPFTFVNNDLMLEDSLENRIRFIAKSIDFIDDKGIYCGLLKNELFNNGIVASVGYYGEKISVNTIEQVVIL
ncbi:MAG TPA: hypothetical protein PK411_11435 [Mesotoga infera]|nr:hypothetical protein [Mesotoga infera]HRV03051.1 hypothetical protein [Mesotoga sp.]